MAGDQQRFTLWMTDPFRTGALRWYLLLCLLLILFVGGCAHSADGWAVSVHTVLDPSSTNGEATGATEEEPPPSTLPAEGDAAPVQPPSEETDAQRQATPAGTVLVAKGEIEGEPAQLWLYLPEEVEPAQIYEGMEGQGQFVWGQPVTYLSNRISYQLQLSDDFFSAKLHLETSGPEIDEDSRGREKFIISAALDAGEPVPAGFLPDGVRDVSPEQLSRPKTLRYLPGQDPPDGYYLESTRRWDLAALGGLIFAVSYGAPVGIAAALGFPDRSGVIAIPVAGPLIIYHRYLTSEKCCAYGLLGVLAVTEVLVGASILQAGGLALMALGPFQKKHRWVRERNWLSVTPVVDPYMSGLNVNVEF